MCPRQAQAPTAMGLSLEEGRSLEKLGWVSEGPLPVQGQGSPTMWQKEGTHHHHPPGPGLGPGACGPPLQSLCAPQGFQTWLESHLGKGRKWGLERTRGNSSEIDPGCAAHRSPLTGRRGLSGHLAQSRAKLDGDLAHPLQVSILLGLQIFLLCLQLLHVRKEVPLDDCLEALPGEIRARVRAAIQAHLPLSTDAHAKATADHPPCHLCPAQCSRV